MREDASAARIRLATQQQPQSINRRHLPSSQTGRRRVMGNVVVTVPFAPRQQPSIIGSLQ
ncbi:hypothetical protein INR49_028177, partial [Caranx melampygus]